MISAAALLLFFLASCAVVPHRKGPEQHRLALVLGGGGARGFAHVGVIRELEAEKIPIHQIVGVSVGSLVGALYADSADSFDLEWKAFQIEKKDIFDLSVLNFQRSLAKGQALREYLDRHLPNRNIEDLKIPLAIVAVDLRTGDRVVFTRGPVREAVCASAALPGVFEPVPWTERLLVDGGVMGNLPPEVAEDLGADVIVGVNIPKGRSEFSGEPPGPLGVIIESIGIMGDELIRLNRSRFDALIEPDVGSVGIMDFDHKKELMEAGRQAARKEIPRIRALMGL
jgi:NTE family protein